MKYTLIDDNDTRTEQNIGEFLACMVSSRERFLCSIWCSFQFWSVDARTSCYVRSLVERAKLLNQLTSPLGRFMENCTLSCPGRVLEGGTPKTGGGPKYQPSDDPSSTGVGLLPWSGKRPTGGFSGIWSSMFLSCSTWYGRLRSKKNLVLFIFSKRSGCFEKVMSVANNSFVSLLMS